MPTINEALGMPGMPPWYHMKEKNIYIYNIYLFILKKYLLNNQMSLWVAPNSLLKLGGLWVPTLDLDLIRNHKCASWWMWWHRNLKVGPGRNHGWFSLQGQVVHLQGCFASQIALKLYRYILSLHPVRWSKNQPFLCFQNAGLAAA